MVWLGGCFTTVYLSDVFHGCLKIKLVNDRSRHNLLFHMQDYCNGLAMCKITERMHYLLFYLYLLFEKEN